MAVKYSPATMVNNAWNKENSSKLCAYLMRYIVLDQNSHYDEKFDADKITAV